MKYYIWIILFFLSIPLFAKEIDYTLIIDNPHRNYFNIEILYNTEKEEYIDFVMPAWTPGSYIIKNWSKNVFDVQAKNENDSILTCFKTDKQTWRVLTNQSENICPACKRVIESDNVKFCPYCGHKIDK